VKPPVFKYHDPTTLTEALDLLAEFGDSAKILAGGQSLVPLLNFRLARPEHVVDVNGVAELNNASGPDGCLCLGAMVRQAMLGQSPTIARACPPIAQAMPFVGHPQIRNRGTLGGSLAHADPAAELPAVMLAVDAQFTLQSKRAQRVVAADDFYVGPLVTVLRSDEMLVRIDLPRWPERTASSVLEVAIRAGDFALAGVVASGTLDQDGRVSGARIVCFGVGDRPVRIHEAEVCIEDRAPVAELLNEAGRIVSARVEPVEDIHASAAYRKRASGILAVRALAAAFSSIPPVVG
jgi:carbon-monoxide dehydrogenase medium subunit